ncbi:hypothetical protein CWI71_02675 [Pseudidiomarina insulisalsae]|uniref:DUF2306 domain-containing protein n=2 Tax=Pseudidiomarina insulisalsae TaxID=575789 RepID=A0A432YPY9_9GAMM|nr:hypothetical protein CWI71_02675 [Pseudidiomarina insulisalsae]
MFYQFLFYLHVSAGVMAILVFWVPVLTRKGGLNHQRFGRYYRRLMYTVAGAAIIMSLLLLTIPTQVKPELLNADNLRTTLLNVRAFALFLLLLGYITFISVLHGQLALSAQQDRRVFRQARFLFLVAGLNVLSLLVLYVGWTLSQPLMLVFGGLGLFDSINTWRYIYKSQVSARAWLCEHLSGYIGSGIAAYTAFITFGARHLLTLPGYWQLLFWVLPGVIGSVFIFQLSRKYDPQRAPATRKVTRKAQ